MRTAALTGLVMVALAGAVFAVCAERQGKQERHARFELLLNRVRTATEAWKAEFGTPPVESPTVKFTYPRRDDR